MFISFEGIDGSGKSTQIKLLADHLEAEGHCVKVFREPGGTLLSEHIRALLLDPAFDIHPFSEMLLFSAARSQLVETQIKPGLAAGNIIICDRFFDSTVAYQGAGRNLEDEAWIKDFQRRVTGGLIPERTYLLQIPLETALSRRVARANGIASDRMENSDVTFFQRVHAAYAKIAKEEPDRIAVFDGVLPSDVLHAEIWADFTYTWDRSAGTRV